METAHQPPPSRVASPPDASAPLPNHELFATAACCLPSACGLDDAQAIDLGPWTAKEPLTLTVTNEYDHFDRRALSLYDLDIVIEPYRETKITVMHQGASTSRFQWLLIQSDGQGVPLEGVQPIIEAKGGKFATVLLTEAGESYALLVKQLAPDGSDLAVRRATISCKYVRRELRELTMEDRTAFFATMREFYTVGLEEGREKYGSGFANAKVVAAVHNSQVSRGVSELPKSPVLFAIFHRAESELPKSSLFVA